MSKVQTTLVCARWIANHLYHRLFRLIVQWRLPALHLSLATAHARRLRPHLQPPHLTHPRLHPAPRRLQLHHARLRHRPLQNRHRRRPVSPTGSFTVVAAPFWPR